MATGYRPEWVQGAFVDLIGSHLNPFWSLTVPKIRLLARHRLSDDLIALRFETNRAFRQQALSFEGGQHLNLSVVIEGVYHQRSYSLVGLPQQSLWWHDDVINSKADKNKARHTVTVAIKPQGMVSDYLTTHMPIGTTIHSGLPTGSFTLAQSSLAQGSLAKQIHLPTEIQSARKKSMPLLFIAGGSGITPMLGLITEALQYGHQVTLLHYNRTLLLQSQWQQLANDYPDFTYHLIDTEDSSTYLAGTRHLSSDSLLALDLPWAKTLIFACGSHSLLAGLYDAASQITLPDGKSLRDNIIVESFGTTLPNTDKDSTHDPATETRTVYLRGRQRQFSSETTLLTAAEKAGIRLNYGCRQGICQLCRCQKISGVVKNVQTGKLSHDGNESIQTCINVAVTDVILDV